MTHVRVPIAVVEQTLAFLKDAGTQHDSEGVVLWLGKRSDAGIAVSKAFIPQQIASSDYFHIPPASMTALLRHLGDTRTFIAAQVHSHPRKAFHSHADDTWAIVRHVGALSIVVPDFAATTSIHNFMAKAAAYRLSPDNTWELVPLEELQQLVTIS